MQGTVASYKEFWRQEQRKVRAGAEREAKYQEVAAAHSTVINERDQQLSDLKVYLLACCCHEMHTAIDIWPMYDLPM